MNWAHFAANICLSNWAAQKERWQTGSARALLVWETVAVIDQPLVACAQAQALFSRLGMVGGQHHCCDSNQLPAMSRL